MSEIVPIDVYAALDTEAQATARAAVDRIAAIQHRLIGDVIDIGRTLLNVKGCMGHGHFLPWLKSEFGWTERTAQNYISVAERFGSNTKPVSYLPISTVYRLAAPSTPDDVRDQIVARLEAGETLPSSMIVGEITDARRAAEREREEAKKSPAAKASAKAARTRRDRARVAEMAKYQERQDRRDAARKEAAKIIIGRVRGDDLARLIELLDEVSLGRGDIADAVEALA